MQATGDSSGGTPTWRRPRRLRDAPGRARSTARSIRALSVELLRRERRSRSSSSCPCRRCASRRVVECAPNFGRVTAIGADASGTRVRAFGRSDARSRGSPDTASPPKDNTTTNVMPTTACAGDEGPRRAANGGAGGRPGSGNIEADRARRRRWRRRCERRRGVRRDRHGRVRWPRSGGRDRGFRRPSVGRVHRLGVVRRTRPRRSACRAPRRRG